MEETFENSPSIYDKEGRVVDPEIARKGAMIENEYRRKLFGLFKRSKAHVAEGEVAAEIEMENTQGINVNELPDVINEEFNKYSESVGGDIELLDAIVGELGDGVLRYRLNCEINEGIGLVGFGSKTLASDLKYVVIIVDVKDGKIIQSDAVDAGVGYGYPNSLKIKGL